MDLLQNSLEIMLMYPNLLQLVGVIGFLTYVIGFAMVQNEKICGNGVLYPASKVFAAICVLISLVGAFNLASCLIQLSYIVIGLYGIAVRRKKSRTGNQSMPEPTYATSPENIFVLSDVSRQATQQTGLDRCG
jgi:predicted membrane protein